MLRTTTTTSGVFTFTFPATISAADASTIKDSVAFANTFFQSNLGRGSSPSALSTAFGTAIPNFLVFYQQYPAYEASIPVPSSFLCGN